MILNDENLSGMHVNYTGRNPSFTDEGRGRICNLE